MGAIYGLPAQPSGDYTSARFEAIRALAAIGPAAKDALPGLRRLAQEQAGRDGSASPYPRDAESAIRAIERK